MGKKTGFIRIRSRIVDKYGISCIMWNCPLDNRHFETEGEGERVEFFDGDGVCRFVHHCPPF